MNSLTKYFSLRNWAIYLACSIMGFSNALSAQNNLFTEVSPATLTQNQAMILNKLQQHESTLNLRVVRVNKEHFLNGDSINLNLFPGVSFTAFESKTEKRGTSDYTWYGNVPGEMSNILLTVYEDAVVGFMSVGDKSYNLRSLGDGLNVIIHADPGKYPSCGNTPETSNQQRLENRTKENQDTYPIQIENRLSASSVQKTTQGNSSLQS